MTIRVAESVLNHVVALVDADAQATLGRSYESDIRKMAEVLRDSFARRAAQEEAGEAAVDEDWDLDRFFDRVAEDAQRYFQESDIEPLWPRCPEHGDHPLRLVDDYWTCDKSNKAFARLGEMRQAKVLDAPVPASRPPVEPGKLEGAFRQLAAERGVNLDSDPHTRVFAALVAFYAEVRVQGCDPADDEDMLLLEWGSYDWGPGRAYEVDLFRQVLLPTGGKGEPLGQLHVVYRFPNEGELARLPAGNDWWGSPGRVQEFEAALADNPALRAVAGKPPLSVEIYYQQID